MAEFDFYRLPGGGGGAKHGNGAMMKLIQSLERRSRLFLMLAGLGFIIPVGIIDYLTGSELSFSVVYLLGIGLATWFIGRGYGLFLSVLSVAVWIAGDFAAGARYQPVHSRFGIQRYC